MNIDEIFIEGVGLLHLCDPYADSKNEKVNYVVLKEYLENTGYTNISKAKETYDMVGLNPQKNRFICEMIFPFSTGVSQEKRAGLIANKVEVFLKLSSETSHLATPEN